MSRFAWRDRAALVFLLFGLTQMAGDLCGSRILKGIGAASVIAPCPKVFCNVNGLEGFASTFTLRMETQAGSIREIEITPEVYRRLRGPYNRRNAYGAALSFAPKLPLPLWQSVYDYGWRENGPLRIELGLPGDVKSVTTLIRTHTRDRDDTWILESQSPR